jgi:hypothetical protein
MLATNCTFLAVQFLDFFLKGNLSLEAHPRRKPHDWLPKQGWQDLMKLTELAANKGPVGALHTLRMKTVNRLPEVLSGAQSEQGAGHSLALLACSLKLQACCCPIIEHDVAACYYDAVHVAQVTHILSPALLMTLPATGRRGEPTTSLMPLKVPLCPVATATASVNLRSCCSCGAYGWTEWWLASRTL